MHVTENLADSNQLFAQLGVPRNLTDVAVLAYIRAFEDRMRDGLRQVAAAPRAALFAPACVAHTENLNFLAGTRVHDGRNFSFRDSLAAWWWNATGVPAVLVDACDGIACNPSCPPAGAHPGADALLVG